MVRQRRCIALVVAFLIGCAFLLMADASRVLAEASQHNKQKHGSLSLHAPQISSLLSLESFPG